MENEIDSLHLHEFLSTGVIRKILTGHMIALHFAPILCQMNKSMKSGVKEKAGTSFAAAGSKFDLVQNNNASRRQKVDSR